MLHTPQAEAASTAASAPNRCGSILACASARAAPASRRRGERGSPEQAEPLVQHDAHREARRERRVDTFSVEASEKRSAEQARQDLRHDASGEVHPAASEDRERVVAGRRAVALDEEIERVAGFWDGAREGCLSDLLGGARLAAARAHEIVDPDEPGPGHEVLHAHASELPPRGAPEVDLALVRGRESQATASPATTR